MTPEERKLRALVRKMILLLDDASYEVKKYTDGRNDRWFDKLERVYDEAEALLLKKR